MKDFFEKLNKLKQAAGLEEKRKSELRAELLRFMEGRESAEEVPAPELRREPRLIFGYLTRPMALISAVLVVALIGGGAAAAAEKSLPGNWLYSVKVGFNEKVAGAVKLSSAAKADYESTLAARRLDELSALAASGKIDQRTENQLEKRFSAHAEKAEEQIRKLATSDQAEAAADISSRLEGSLRAHRQIIAALKQKDEKLEAVLKPLEENVEKTIKAAAAARIDSELKVEAKEKENGRSKLGVKAAAEEKLGAAAEAVKEAESFVQNKRAQLGKEAAAEVQAGLEEAKELTAESQAKLEAGAYTDAFRIANKAARVAQGVQKVTDASTSLDLKIAVPHVENSTVSASPATTTLPATTPLPAE